MVKKIKPSFDSDFNVKVQLSTDQTRCTSCIGFGANILFSRSLIMKWFSKCLWWLNKLLQTIERPWCWVYLVLQVRVSYKLLQCPSVCVVCCVDVQVNSPLSAVSEVMQQPEVRLKQEGASSPDDRQVGVRAYGQISVWGYINRLRGTVQQSQPGRLLIRLLFAAGVTGAQH